MARDWEETFASWGRPPGTTQEDKCGNAERAIKKAIAASRALASRDVTVFPQGSYRNRTSVKLESDVDICVRCNESFFFDLPDGASTSDFGISTPAGYPYSQFKADVGKSLVDYFGSSHVMAGRKAFDVHENSYRVDADVIPTFEYRRYAANGRYLSGTAFLDDGALVKTINWPDQNYENGRAKNDSTNRRFRAVVRILKTLRNEMAEARIAAADPIPSYLSECLVWNVPNEGFDRGSYVADVRWALAHLFNSTLTEDAVKEWGEVNELKYLFRTGQPWNREAAHAFLAHAWDYIGFK